MSLALPGEMDRIVMVTGLVELFLGRLEGVENRIELLESQLGAAGLHVRGVGQAHLPPTLDAKSPPRMGP